jgi:hypothetical protein
MIIVSSVMHIELVAWYEAIEQSLTIDKFALRLRVKDNIECPPKLCCWNELGVLYSYDNKPCAHAKHIMIMIKFCVVKGENSRPNHKSWASKYQIYMLVDLLTKDLSSSAFREITIDMGFW